MSQAELYRSYAEACFQVARNANDAERARWVMAQHWLHCTQEEELKDKPNSNKPPQPRRDSAALFTNYPHSLLLLHSQISTPARLIFVTHRDDIQFIPAQQRAPTGGACWRSGERRLRVRSTQPDLRGSRETLPGPITWVRPATGW